MAHGLHEHQIAVAGDVQKLQSGGMPAAKATCAATVAWGRLKWKVFLSGAAHVCLTSCPEATAVWSPATVMRMSWGHAALGASTQGIQARALRSWAHARDDQIVVMHFDCAVRITWERSCF